MRIGINSRIYQNKETGIPYYIKFLYTKLLELDKDNRYVFFQTNNNKKIGKTTTFNISNNSFGAFLFDNIFINKLIKQENLAVFHGPASILPFFKRRGLKYILTVPDLAFLVYPDHWSKIFFYYYRFALKRALQNADLIIAISKNTKKDIIRYYKVDDDKIKVIYLGVNDIYLNSTKRKRLINEKYFFSITTHPKRKNILSIIKIFSQTNHLSEYKFVIAGLIQGKQLAELKENLKSLNLEERVILFGYGTEDQLASLYQHADFFIYPSFYEGFGLPVLEAMACGCPVITSSNSSMSEIVSDKRWLFDPKSLEDISRKIVEITSLSDNERRLLINKNMQFSRKFTWKETAMQHLALINSVSGGSNKNK